MLKVAYGIAHLLLAVGVCFGQTVATGPAPTKATRELTPQQLAERLEKVKTEILPKVMTPKIAADPLKVKHYLEQWHTVTSDHYLLFTNGPEVSCRKFAASLERLYGVVKKELPFEDIDHLMTCYIFDSADEYYAFTVQVAGWSESAAKATAGHANAQYYATYYQSPTAPVVYHEATHEIVGACLKVGGVGSWFQEGVAMYFEKRMGPEKPGLTMKNDMKNRDCYPLEEFFAIPTLLSDPKGHGHRNYDQACALLDFLINTKVAPVAGKFGSFLKAARGHGFARGADLSAKLVQQVYGLTVPELEDKWREHLGVK